MTGVTSKTDWTLIVDPVGRSAESNMATDNALLDKVVESGGAFLRLYRWDPPTLSIGRNQLVSDVPPNVPWVRRPTGGTAVWHEHEVTYAVAAPIALFGSLRAAYCRIHTRIAAALRSMGIEAVLAPARLARPARLISCFASEVGGEILVGGKKLVGSAQVRRADAFLQHGSILLAGSQQRVAAITHETTLTAVLAREVTFEEITTAIVANWGDTLSPSHPRPSGSPLGSRPSVVASVAP